MTLTYSSAIPPPFSAPHRCLIYFSSIAFIKSKSLNVKSPIDFLHFKGLFQSVCVDYCLPLVSELTPVARSNSMVSMVPILKSHTLFRFLFRAKELIQVRGPF
jgi:hypothetical protein